MPRPSKYPISSFDPRFRELLLKGAMEEIRLDFPTKKAAIAFQQRLQLYRATVRKEGKPEEYEILYRCRTSRRDSGTMNDPSTLYIRPNDIQFSQVFDQVDLTTRVPLPSKRPQVLDVPETSSEEPPVTIDDLLADLKGIPE